MMSYFLWTPPVFLASFSIAQNLQYTRIIYLQNTLIYHLKKELHVFFMNSACMYDSQVHINECLIIHMWILS